MLTQMKVCGDGQSDAMPVSALRLHRSLAWPVGQLEARLPASFRAPSAGTSISASAASADGWQTLFTGQTLSVSSGLWGARLLVEEASGPLTRSFVNKAFRSVTAGSMIHELCGDVSCSVTGPGTLFPYKTVLANRSALDHICEIARLSGFIVYTDVEGKLHAGMAPVTPAGILTASDPIVDFRAEAEPFWQNTEALYGAGALGLHGPGAETWVLKDNSSLSSGSGSSEALLPSLKTLESVALVAEANAQSLREARGRITVVYAGPPPADLGQLLTLTGFQSGNGIARVYAIDVRWNAETGLLTQLQLRGIDG